MPSRISERPRLAHDGSVRMRKNGIDVDARINPLPLRNEAQCVSNAGTLGADEGSLCEPPPSLAWAKDVPSVFETVSQRISQLMNEEKNMKKPPRRRKLPTQPRRVTLLEPAADVTSPSFDTSRDDHTSSPESSSTEVLSKKNSNNKRQQTQEDEAFPLLSAKRTRMTNKKEEHIFSANTPTRLAGESAPTKIEEWNAYEKMEQKKLEISLESEDIKKKPLPFRVYPKPGESAHVWVEIELPKEPQKNRNIVSSEHKEIMMEQPFSTED
eukprot:scaffold461520_cov47-Attheya_sp.AAC.1